MRAKIYLSKLVRMFGLTLVADKGYYYFQYCKNFFANRKFKARHKDFVLPPDCFLSETYNLNYNDYYHDGRQTAIEIMELLDSAIDLNERGRSILDWGCGPGRVVRHLPELLLGKGSIYGSDYNQAYVNWCSEYVPGVTFLKNELRPPMSFPDHSFDCIYGLSILTHLSADNHFAWIKEMHRLLKKGGVLLVTTQGNAYKRKLLSRELKQFENNELVIRHSEVEGHRVYSAFQSIGFMEELLACFTVVRFIPGGTAASIHGLQDTWLVKKMTI